MLVQGGQKRDTLFADTPTIYELMDKHKSSEPVRRLAAVLLSPGAIGRLSHSAAQRVHGPAKDPARGLREDDQRFGISADAKKRDWDVEFTSGQELKRWPRKRRNHRI